MALLNISVTVLLGLCSGVLADTASLQNLYAQHIVDLTNTYRKDLYQSQVVNVGSEHVASYQLLSPKDSAATIADIEVHDVAFNDLDVFPSRTVEIQNYAAYDIVFEAPLKPQEKVEFGLRLKFSEPSKPYPPSAKQSDHQMLSFKGTRNIVSLYDTQDQKTELKLLAPEAEVFEKDGTVSKVKCNANNFLVFGPYENVKPLDEIESKFRFENPKPLPRVQSLDRAIWVSHWGSTISFDESYDVQNVGTKLDGPFSRSDYTSDRSGFSLNAASIHKLTLSLPKNHREEYFVDSVGNVSTSRILEDSIQVSPRFPVMGGWFYNFTIGYAADLRAYVRETSSSNYILAVPVVSESESFGYAKVTNHFVSPEGAKIIDVVSDAPYNHMETSVTYSYLDLFGRPTVSLSHKNLVNEQATNMVYITYKYSTSTALRKPATYATLLFVGFMSSRSASSLF